MGLREKNWLWAPSSLSLSMKQASSCCWAGRPFRGTLGPTAGLSVELVCYVVFRRLRATSNGELRTVTVSGIPTTPWAPLPVATLVGARGEDGMAVLQVCGQNRGRGMAHHLQIAKKTVLHVVTI